MSKPPHPRAQREAARSSSVAKTTPELEPGRLDRHRQQRGGRHPGRHVHLEELHHPVGGDDRVGPGHVPQPEHLVRAHRRLGDRLGDGDGQPRRRVVGRHPRRVPRRVVEHPAGRHDLHRRQRDRPGPEVDHRDRHLDAFHVRLQQHRVPVRQAGHHRRRQLGRRPDHPRAERGPALRRLHHQRQPEPLDDPVQHHRGAQLAERRVRQRDPGRRGQPGRVHDRLRRRLVPRHPAGRRVRAHVPHAGQVEHRPQRAVLAVGTVQRDEHRVRPVGVQPGEQLAVRVEHPHRDAGLLQRLAHPAARVQRDLPLVRQSAGQDDGGEVDADAAGLTPAPGPALTSPAAERSRRRRRRRAPRKVARSSSSCSTTPASRRTPSRIRSGVG